jgi:hypothetical protein
MSKRVKESWKVEFLQRKSERTAVVRTCEEKVGVSEQMAGAVLLGRELKLKNSGGSEAVPSCVGQHGVAGAEEMELAEKNELAQSYARRDLVVER